MTTIWHYKHFNQVSKILHWWLLLFIVYKTLETAKRACVDTIIFWLKRQKIIVSTQAYN